MKWKTASVRAAICLAGSVLAYAPGAQAQEATPAPEPAQSEPVVGDIVVTAQKRSESINKVGMSITALSGDTLVQQGIVSTADLIRAVPGFNFTQSSYGTPVYTLRGIGFYDTSLGSSPTVSVYVDEVPLPYSSLTTGAALDLERVEVLKGPQGTLFGQNATGGAINYIAAKPTAQFAAGADLSYGRFNAVDARGFVSGPISDTLRARLAVSYMRADPWQESYTRDDEIGRTDVLIGRLLLDWTPVERLKLSLNVNGWRDRSDNQAGQLIAAPTAILAGYPRAPAQARAADWDPNSRFRRDNGFWQASLRAEYDLDFATLTSISSYQKLDRDGTTDADGTARPVFNISVPGSIKVFSQEVRLAGDTDGLRWVVGGNYQRERVSDAVRAFYPESSLPVDGADPRTVQRVRTYAVFGNLDYQVTPAVTVQGGLRYTDQRRRFNGCTFDDGSGQGAALASFIIFRATGQQVTLQPGSCVSLSSDLVPSPYIATLSEDSVLWRAGVNWQVAPRALLYTNISKGYKSGAFPTLGASFHAGFAPVTQESVLAYEAGFKVNLGGRAQVNGAAFYYDYTDKQLRGRRIDPIGGPLNALINIPKSGVTGAELQLNWRPVNQFTLNLGGTWIDTEIKGDFINYDALARLGNFKGDSFPLTPKWQLNGDAEYRVQLADALQGFIAGNFTYQSATNAGLGNIPLLDIRSYWLVDGRLGVRGRDDRWNASIFARNLTDTYYWNYVSTTAPDAVVRLAGRPRTFGVMLGFRY